MNCTLNKVIIFAVGAAIGSAATWFILDKKYEKMVKEEAESIKEELQRKYDIQNGSEEKPEVEEGEPREKLSDLAKTYAELIKKNKYSEDNTEVSRAKGPYVISPDEYGEIDDYELVSLTYYADKILADDNDDIIENVDELIGLASLETFGEYEEDSVFVRNDELEKDFEILLDVRSYSEVVYASEE